MQKGIGVIVAIVSLLLFGSPAFSKENVSTRAQIGDILFSSNGFTSPYAMVSLETPQGIRVSARALSSGAFSFENIPVKSGLSEACFTSEDIKGDTSLPACVSFTGLMKDTVYPDLFLPPSASLSATRIPYGQPLRITGYSLPNIAVNAIVDGVPLVPTLTDLTGFYALTLDSLTEGTHKLFLHAQGNEKTSLITKEPLSFMVLSLSESMGVRVLGFFQESFLPTIGVFALALIILGIIRFRTFFRNALSYKKK